MLLAPWDGRCISWLADGSGTACSRLPPPPPPPPGPGGPASVGMQHAVVQLRRAVPRCATPCRAKQQSSGLKARHRAVSTHSHAEGCGAELNLPLPSPHPPRCSMLQPWDWPYPCKGVPGGRQARWGGEGMEPPSSRSRPLVSRMSRRCHTHLMWFLAGAAAALSRLIAARRALQTDSRAPCCPRDTRLARSLRWLQPLRDARTPQGCSDPPQGRGADGGCRRSAAAPSRAIWGAALSNEGGVPGFGEQAGMEERRWRCFARGDDGPGGFGARGGEELTASPSPARRCRRPPACSWQGGWAR